MSKICLNAAESPKCSNPAVWYYSAAFVSDLAGNLDSASSLLSLAEKASGPEIIKESIRIFRMYLDAKTSLYDDEYKARLFNDLEWLDGLIQTRITDQVRKTTEYGYDLKISLSYYYWNDMLRKIVIGEVVPRLKDQGDEVLALRLLNMADNRLLDIVDSHVSYTENGWKSMSMRGYRNNTKYFNDFDYSNYFFREMDSMDVESVIRYASEVFCDYPKSAFDSFLDMRGFVDKDYIYELIGTRYLRARDYKNAVLFLSKVSRPYQAKTNINAYADRDPFEYSPTRGKLNKQYKLSFARKMAYYQNVVETLRTNEKLSAKDYDNLGEAMVYMGIGQKSAFDYCWALTQYSYNEEDQWYNTDYRESALEEAKSLIDQGLELITDHELAARLNVKVCRWRTAATRYADSRTGKKTRSGCDKLTDYQFSIQYTGRY
ncbi:MAG: hypothetical protein MJZ16_00490 [Bacteroidales bacterium]|nr:hypothetical protein [Bacteroidales bacterium]